MRKLIRCDPPTKLIYLKKDKGFTLVELLVVIAIIAILAVIAITTYTGAQQTARDGRRRAEIAQLAKSIESVKDFQTGFYRYPIAVANADFPRGLPDDPNTAASSNHYCMSTNRATTTPPALTSPNTNWASPTTCDTATLFTAIGGGGAESNQSSVPDAINAGTLPKGTLNVGTVRAWTICASMERASAPFCISSLTQ